MVPLRLVMKSGFVHCRTNWINATFHKVWWLYLVNDFSIFFSLSLIEKKAQTLGLKTFSRSQPSFLFFLKKKKMNGQGIKCNVMKQKANKIFLIAISKSILIKLKGKKYGVSVFLNWFLLKWKCTPNVFQILIYFNHFNRNWYRLFTRHGWIITPQWLVILCRQAAFMQSNTMMCWTTTTDPIEESDSNLKLDFIKWIRIIFHPQVHSTWIWKAARLFWCH